jgi:hypothetical protein
MSGNLSGAGLIKELIWAAGAVQVGIVLANVPLLGRLRVGERLAGVPRFLRQIVYVHWAYILIVVGMFAALCFGFAAELAGASGLGRFLSGFRRGSGCCGLCCRFSITTRSCGGKIGKWIRCIWCR